MPPHNYTYVCVTVPAKTILTGTCTTTEIQFIGTPSMI